MRFTPTSSTSPGKLTKANKKQRTQSTRSNSRASAAEASPHSVDESKGPADLNYRDNCHAHSAARFRAGSRRFRCVRYLAVVFLEESGLGFAGASRRGSAPPAISSPPRQKLDECSQRPDLLEGPLPHVFPKQPKRRRLGRYALC